VSLLVRGAADEDFRLEQVVAQLFIDFLEQLAAHGVVAKQVVVLFDHIGHFGLGEAVGKDFGLRLYLGHQVRVLVDDLPDLALQVGPDLFFVLDDVLSFVELVLQVVYLVLQVLDLVVLLLLEVCKHLLKDQDLGLVALPLLKQSVNLPLHTLVSLNVGLQLGLV